MADASTATRLRATVGTDWSVFDDLARLDEPIRRRVLRPHREGGFDVAHDGAARALRDRLDGALDRLMLLEVGFEAGLLEPADLPLNPGLLLLLDSADFARYLHAYLYVGVRFLASRLVSQPVPPVPVHGSELLNELPLALPGPPPLLPRFTAADARPGADDAVARWLEVLAETAAQDHVGEALRFLDDSVLLAGEQAEYTRWLEGVSSRPEDDPRFVRVTEGLLAFVQVRVAFYLALDEAPDPHPWRPRHPLTARIGVMDLYWLARLLRAEVSVTGRVSYDGESWLARLAGRAGEGSEAWRILRRQEDVLRAVFDYTCDLVQNAADLGAEWLARAADPDACPEWPAETVGWRAACDEELAEVARQRRERRPDDATVFDPPPMHGSQPGNAVGRSAGSDDGPPPRTPWSWRIRSGEQVEDLIGVAFSGGGIRSATFNLGVLQRLQELDLLRHVDYLSTVSGGGYIGAWLLGNVRRTQYWLSRLTDWGPSIDHLRRYSNYLAPHGGLMSADSWSIWGSWVRNALLVQTTAAIWLAVVLLVGRLARVLFTSAIFGAGGTVVSDAVLASTLVVLTASVYRSLGRRSRVRHESWVLAGAVAPAWVGAFGAAAVLWASRGQAPARVSEALSAVLTTWAWPMAALLTCFALLSWVSVDATVVRPLRRLLVAAGAATAALAVAVFGLAVAYWTAGQGRGHGEVWAWGAFVAGPPLVLVVMTLSVVTLIGLVGHDAPDWRREWWTRFGAWLGIAGVVFLGIGLTSAAGPWLFLRLALHSWGSVKWGAAVGWVATVIGGLLAGGGEQTDGRARSATDAALGWFARAAAMAFVAGAVILGSAALHSGLVAMWTDLPVLGSYQASLLALQPAHYLWSLGGLLVLGGICSWRFEINIFGLNQFYRNRLVRCYLGATRWRPGLRTPDPFTGFDEQDDLLLASFRRDAWRDRPYRGPFPLVNCALNLGGSSDLGLHTRHSASFVLTPLRAGADRARVGYARACADGPRDPVYAGGVFLGQAISVSGAAASPNQGFHSSPLVAFLLTMFNVRLAWWFPNPGRRFWDARWLRFSLWYLVQEMFALADERKYYVNVSDGGHFENLGIYELVRRRCRVIIASDAECDPDLTFGSLGNVVRMCETDFGARIHIDVDSIRRQAAGGTSRAHCAVGRIEYGNGSRGYLIYLKSSISGDEDIGIAQYRSAHAAFPHESTGDQFFSEDQFEAYRRLGYHVAAVTFRDVEDAQGPVAMAQQLADLWTPASATTDTFVGQTAGLDALWERFRQSPALFPLLRELTADRQAPLRGAPTEEEVCICLELIQQMENVFLALRLDEFWAHPDNRGWATTFRTWAKSATFRQVWQQSRGQFGTRFGHFCGQHLGL